MTLSGEPLAAFPGRYLGVASTAARAYLAFGVLAVGLNAVLGGHRLLFGAIGLTSAAVVVGGTILHQPPAWKAWIGLALSQALVASGDLAYLWFASGSPSIADGLSLVGEALLIVSVARLAVSVG